MIDINKAIKLDSSSSPSYLIRAICNIAFKDDSAAMNDYNKAISLDFNSTIGYKRRADFKELLQDYTGARDDYDKAIALDPKDGEAYYSRGMLKLKYLNVDDRGCADLSMAAALGNKDALDEIEENCE